MKIYKTFSHDAETDLLIFIDLYSFPSQSLDETTKIDRIRAVLNVLYTALWDVICISYLLQLKTNIDYVITSVG